MTTHCSFLNPSFLNGLILAVFGRALSAPPRPQWCNQSTQQRMLPLHLLFLLVVQRLARQRILFTWRALQRKAWLPKPLLPLHQWFQAYRLQHKLLLQLSMSLTLLMMSNRTNGVSLPCIRYPISASNMLLMEPQFMPSLQHRLQSILLL